MKTTNAFYFGEVKEEHKHLQTHKTKLGTKGLYLSSGYMVEEKGIIPFSIEEAKRVQEIRFLYEPTLARIDIMEAGKKTVTLLRN